MVVAIVNVQSLNFPILRQFCGVWKFSNPIPIKEIFKAVDGRKRTIPMQATDEIVPIYTFDELATATGYFSNENRLGEGGFGQVYKGVLSNQKVVAVKRLKHYSNPNKEEQARRQFDDEVKTISRIRHRNIVEVVGYCSHKADRLLVYEYVSNNSLKSHLDGVKNIAGNGMPTINWPTRMKIALGTAKGLAYLHEDCVPGIIHRDIKSDNILLNEKFEPKIGDFGLSKDFPESFSHVSTDPRGTHA
ncbi:hypothetical protein P3X46_012198 [Hevea brasiliensis]|uniref:non-specific serine/threonine protein kinase n=1 Tax=Hevea brasiliensis TaxID=3981 RepID=A0ABQ9MBD3_HEVBR|nr:hypothetical protein P3X46_012198 [Hevea brasiliensis]